LCFFWVVLSAQLSADLALDDLRDLVQEELLVHALGN